MALVIIYTNTSHQGAWAETDRGEEDINLCKLTRGEGVRAPRKSQSSLVPGPLMKELRKNIHGGEGRTALKTGWRFVGEKGRSR